jgi:hypothetical protein
MPDKPGEIVYAFGSFVHDGHLPDTISASTRVHFVQPALQVGASGYSKKGITADTRPTKTFAVRVFMSCNYDRLEREAIVTRSSGKLTEVIFNRRRNR